MDTIAKIKNLEMQILELEDDVNHLEDKLRDKKVRLDELKQELRYWQVNEKTNNVNIGDSLFFINEDGLKIEMMLISDCKENLDLVFLTDCSYICDAWARGTKLNKKYHNLDSLIEYVEDYEGLKFLGYDE